MGDQHNDKRERRQRGKIGVELFRPMAPEFAEFLMQTPEDERSGYLFTPRSCRHTGKRLRLDTVSKLISRVGRAAGIKVAEREKNGDVLVKCASAHDLRRAFGFRWSNLVMPCLS